MRKQLTGLVNLCSLPGLVIGWLVLVIIVLVCLAVIAAQLGINNYGDWDGSLFILGGGITVNTLLDLQWWCFALIVLFGGVLAFRDKSHVSVDFLSVGFSPQTRLWIQMVGDLILLVPFCAIIVWYGSKFAVTSWNSGEASSYGGLRDVWVIKSFVPIGFGLLGIAGLARAALAALTLWAGDAAQEEPHV